MTALPSLNGLRSFEVAARCGSFVVAGDELGVSSAAVSLQIKNLEIHLGKKLFIRAGNRITLTDAGEEMYPRLASAFAELSAATQVVQQDRQTDRLVISVLPILSELWLLPRALQFREDTGIFPDIRVQDDPVKFEQDVIDVRLTYGSALYRDYLQLQLFSDVAIPVCRPDFWAQYFGEDPRGMSAVPTGKLIHNQWGPNYASEPKWADWFIAAGLDQSRSSGQGMLIDDMALAISAARIGAGVALAPSVLVARDLARGTLMAPSNVSLKMKRDYVCVLPNAKKDSAKVRKFLDYLDIAQG
ncbi:MAG: LysR family glycine cleavage system transcriptional activator [Yoonia sp.]|jgi:LysR family glycine cleavage system transcriptional activator